MHPALIPELHPMCGKVRFRQGGTGWRGEEARSSAAQSVGFSMHPALIPELHAICGNVRRHQGGVGSRYSGQRSAKRVAVCRVQARKGLGLKV
eukprot:365251-Chlamydomonas_euryale.AAC.5